MSFDTIRYMSGADGESTFIAGTQNSAETVFSIAFAELVGNQGYETRLVVDAQRLPCDQELKNLVLAGCAAAVEFPFAARADHSGSPAIAKALEIRPPVSEETLSTLNRYLARVCKPAAGAVIIDSRGSHDHQIVRI